MRIAVFIKATTFHKDYGGLETQNKALCEGLAKRGHDVLVFSPQHELKFETKYENGVKYHFVPSVYRMLCLNKNNWYHRSQEEFMHFHKEALFNLVISQSSAGVGVLKLAEKKGIPSLAISHGTIMGELQTRIQSAKGLKGYLYLIRDFAFVLVNFFGRQRGFIYAAKKVIAVSSAVKNALIEETFVPEDKIVVVNNGIDPQKIEEAEAIEFTCEKNILYVGQVMHSKGLETLFRLAQEPGFEDVCFRIVGGGPFLGPLKKMVDKAGLQERFVLYGKLPYDKVLGYFKSPNVCAFAFPTKRQEGFPMVLVEALFAGLPLIAYDLGGVSDAICHSATGFLVPPDDYEAFKGHMLDLLENTAAREEMAGNAKEFAYENFTLEKMLDYYEDVFMEVTTKQ